MTIKMETPNEIAARFNCNVKTLRARLRQQFPHHARFTHWHFAVGTRAHAIACSIARELGRV